MARPDIAVGRGVKYYEEAYFGFGRQDGRAIRVDNTNGIIDIRLVSNGRRINNVAYRDDPGINTDIDPYWVELPENYVPGQGFLIAASAIFSGAGNLIHK